MPKINSSVYCKTRKPGADGTGCEPHCKKYGSDCRAKIAGQEIDIESSNSTVLGTTVTKAPEITVTQKETWTDFCKKKTYPDCHQCKVHNQKCRAPDGKGGVDMEDSDYKFEETSSKDTVSVNTSNSNVTATEEKKVHVQTWKEYCDVKNKLPCEPACKLLSTERQKCTSIPELIDIPYTVDKEAELIATDKRKKSEREAKNIEILKQRLTKPQLNVVQKAIDVTKQATLTRSVEETQSQLHDNEAKYLLKIKELQKTPLSIVNCLWGKTTETSLFSKNLVELTEDTTVYSHNIKKLINSFLLLKSLKEHISILEESSQTEKIQNIVNIYEILINPKVQKILGATGTLTKDNCVMLYNTILDHLYDSIRNKTMTKEKASEYIYITIYEWVKSIFQNKSLFSSKNFERNRIISEFIPQLNITSYDSIVTNFENFNVLVKTNKYDVNHIKFSANMKLPDIRVDNPENTKRSVYEKDILYNPIVLLFKIYPIDDMDLGLNFEKTIYNSLNILVKYNFTPNILFKIAESSIDNFDTDFIKNTMVTSKVTTPIYNELRLYNLKKNNPIRKLWSNTGVLITQFDNTITLKDTILRLILNNDKIELTKIIFQILYTLYVFEKLELSHGNLNIKNIYVVTVPEIELCYLVGEQKFKFNTTQLVKFSDFEHSTLCKNTNFTPLNSTKPYIIEQQLNPNREPSSVFNTKYGETNIFNKNLDMISILSHLYIFGDKLGFEGFANIPDIKEFFDSIFSGIYSTKTIIDTYTEALRKSENELEAKRVFNISDIQLITETVPEKTLNMTWLDYIKNVITQKYVHIVKNFDTNVENNHLWIPDNIVPSTFNIIMDDFFKILQTEELFDIRVNVVYSIDDKNLN
jgi:hypothetical protein